MILKSWWWKSQSCSIWMAQLVPYAKFWGESEYQGPRSWFFLCILQYPKWCGDTRIRSGDHFWFGWFKLHLDWFSWRFWIWRGKFLFLKVTLTESPWKTSLDAIWTSQIGDGHLTLSWYPHTIFGIAGYTGRIGTWDLDILILLKILHMVQVEPAKLDNFDFFTTGFLKPFLVVWPN